MSNNFQDPPSENEGGYHIPNRWESFKSRIENLHLPFVGHRFSPPSVRARPEMFCGRCNQTGAPSSLFRRPSAKGSKIIDDAREGLRTIDLAELVKRYKK